MSLSGMCQASRTSQDDTWNPSLGPSISGKIYSRSSCLAAGASRVCDRAGSAHVNRRGRHAACSQTRVGLCLTNKQHAQIRNESNMSKHVFREVPSQDGETRTRKQYSYKKPSGQETKRSAMEWMDEQARSERLEKLQQQVPPTLKTKIGRGDVKPADATRDLAEAKSITALLLPPPPLPVPLFSLVPLAPSAGFLIARRWPLVSPAVRCPFRVSVHLCTCCRSRQEGWGRRTHGTQVSPGQERAMSGKLPLDAGAQGRQAEAQQARRRLCFLSG